MAPRVFVEGYNSLPDGRNIWLFQCNKDETGGFSLLDGHFARTGFKPNCTNQWGGPDFVQSGPSRKRIREEFAPGDWMFMYQAKPDRAVVGVARLGNHRLGTGRRDGSFTTDWTYPVPHLARARLEADDLLCTSELVRVRQGTIFRVSPSQAMRLVELLALSEAATRLVFSRWDPPASFRESFRPRFRAPVTAPRLQDAAKRAVIERHAVKLATHRYHEMGFEVEEVGRPYDLRCRRGNEELHVEVKGTTTDGSAVNLTINEVEHAQQGSHRTDLVIVSDIKVHVDEGGVLESSGGKMVVFEAWRPDPADLRPVQFEYSVPVEEPPATNRVHLPQSLP